MFQTASSNISLRSFSKYKLVNSTGNIKEWIENHIPIFCIIGPLKCGKKTIGRFLAECTEYRVLNQSQKRSISRLKIRTTNARETVENFLSEIEETHRFCQGYIIVDFPTTLQEAALFEKLIKVPNIIIHTTLPLDTFLARVIISEPQINLNYMRISYIKDCKKVNKIAQHYEGKLIKIISYYPPEDVINKVLSRLEDEFGYKFRRLTPKDNFFKTLNHL